MLVPGLSGGIEIKWFVGRLCLRCEWIINYLQTFVKSVSIRPLIYEEGPMLKPFGILGYSVILLMPLVRKGLML